MFPTSYIVVSYLLVVSSLCIVRLYKFFFAFVTQVMMGTVVVTVVVAR